MLATTTAPKMGRPVSVKLSPEAAAKAVADVRAGLPVASALVLAGIARGTVDHCLKSNPSLQRELERAETEFERELVANLVAKSAGSPAVAQWLLERRMAGKWLPVQRNEVTGANGGPLQALTISKALLATVARAPDSPVRNVTPARNARTV